MLVFHDLKLEPTVPNGWARMKYGELLSKHDSFIRACEGFKISKKGEKMVVLYMYKSVTFYVKNVYLSWLRSRDVSCGPIGTLEAFQRTGKNDSWYGGAGT